MHLEWVIFLLCKLHFDKAIFKNHLKQTWQYKDVNSGLVGMQVFAIYSIFTIFNVSEEQKIKTA